MKLIVIIIGLIFLGLAIVIMIKNKNRNTEASNKASSNLISGQYIVDRLHSLGYFKYTRPEKLDSLKREIADTYDKYKVLTTVNDEIPPHQPYCNRFYYCDGETLFEIDGIVDYLKDIKPTFDLMGIPLNWSDDYFSEDGTEHTIIINEKKYVAFEGDPADPSAWGIATKNFVEILNDQLSIHNSDERVYPILFNNDGRIVFLTEPQYKIIFDNFDKKERPMDVKLWWDTFK